MFVCASSEEKLSFSVLDPADAQGRVLASAVVGGDAVAVLTSAPLQLHMFDNFMHKVDGECSTLLLLVHCLSLR
jgi:hypothetical protein